jgi:hypothetical protein
MSGKKQDERKDPPAGKAGGSFDDEKSDEGKNGAKVKITKREQKMTILCVLYRETRKITRNRDKK